MIVSVAWLACNHLASAKTRPRLSIYARVRVCANVKNPTKQQQQVPPRALVCQTATTTIHRSRRDHIYRQIYREKGNTVTVKNKKQVLDVQTLVVRHTLQLRLWLRLRRLGTL